MKKKAATPTEAPTKSSIVGDIHAVRSERYGKWALYQVVQHDGKETGVVALDWFEEDLPAVSRLGGLKPLIVQRYSWRPEPDVFIVSHVAMPQRFVRVGNAPPCFKGKINTYAVDLPSSGSLAAEQEYRWTQLSKSVRDAYKRALKSPKKIQTEQGECSNNMTGRHIEAHEPFNWSQLDVLPMLTGLDVTGKAEGLLEYCIGRPLINALHWSETGATTLDFSATQLEELTVDITGVEKIILNEETNHLSLIGDDALLNKLSIEQPGLQGRYCELELEALKARPVPRYQLPLLSKLTVRCDALDVKRVAQAYPRLEFLKAFGNPGTLRNLASLKKLSQLRGLFLVDLFGFGAADFPPSKAMPALDKIWLSSVPMDAGQWVKQEYGHIPDLSIRKLRDDAWLKVNAQNPFRSWDGRDGITPAHAAKAFDAYKKLAAALQKLPPGDKPTQTLLELITDFTATFNKMRRKSSIETMEREEVSEALRGLMNPFSAAVQAAAFRAFDEARDF